MGCTPRTVTHYVHLPVAIPKELTASCHVDPPPTTKELLEAKSKYPKANSHWEAIGILMTERWNKQTFNLGECNKQIRTIEDWQNKINASIKEKANDSGGGSSNIK